MVVELGVELFAIGVVGYTIYWFRERRKWARLAEEQLRKIKWLPQTDKTYILALDNIFI